MYFAQPFSRLLLGSLLYIIACYVNAVPAHNQTHADTFAAQLKQQVVNALQASEQTEMLNKVKGTKIGFNLDVDAHDVAFAEHEQNRVISISSAFVEHVYTFIHNHIPPQIQQQYPNATPQYLIELALTDIILHELGHHALDLFYNQFTPVRFVPRMEDEAQNWAMQMKVNMDVDPHELGQLLTLFALQDLMHSEYHSAAVPRYQANKLKDKIDYACLGTFSQQAEALCERFGVE
ncbi:MAG: hypothetical protein ABWW63_03015 [Glaciecola sp.]|jgi:hypothetical protein